MVGHYRPNRYFAVVSSELTFETVPWWGFRIRTFIGHGVWSAFVLTTPKRTRYIYLGPER